MVRVLVVGSARESGGGVTSVIKLMEKMPAWERYHCYWLGTQIQAGKLTKIRYALFSYIKALFILWKYDIVHFHAVPDISMKVQLPIFLLAFIFKKKIILHFHVGNQFEDPKIIHYKLFRWCMKKSNLIIVLAHKFEKILEQQYKGVTTPKCVLYNACEEVGSIPYKEHNKTILFAGIFNKNKAGDLLIDAFAKISENHKDWRVQLLGSGPDNLKYKAKVKEYGLDNYIEFPGYLCGEEKTEYFSKAGIYVMCSYNEGFPMVVLEAWSYGIPVVTTPVGGLPEVLKNGKNALVYNFGSVDELAEKLDMLMDDYDLRQSMSIEGKSFVRDKFSPSMINNELMSIYSSLSE